LETPLRLQRTIGSALFSINFVSGRTSVGATDLHHQGVLQTYHQQVSQAIIDWNWDFFRDVAQAMEFVEHKELDTLRFVSLRHGDSL
jgi:hypothetical protein